MHLLNACICMCFSSRDRSFSLHCLARRASCSMCIACVGFLNSDFSLHASFSTAMHSRTTVADHLSSCFASQCLLCENPSSSRYVRHCLFGFLGVARRVNDFPTCSGLCVVAISMAFHGMCFDSSVWNKLHAAFTHSTLQSPKLCGLNTLLIQRTSSRLPRRQRRQKAFAQSSVARE